MATVIQPILNTKTTTGNGTQAPTVALVTFSTTQIPVLIEHAYANQTAGEQPLYLVHMKDGTWVYLPQNLLTQSGGKVVI